MNYTQIDLILRPWIEKNKIQLFTIDRDWQIRSFNINKKFRYLINFPENNNITIKVFDHKTGIFIKKDIVTFESLLDYLNSIL